MISKSFDMDEFVEAVKTKDFLDVIDMADKEATQAQRMLYRRKREDWNERDECERYADNLINFINSLRYGIKLPGLNPSHLKLFKREN